MSAQHHDHPETPGGISPADLDLYALDALPPEEVDALEDLMFSAPPEQQASMRAHVVSTWEVVADLVAGADLDVAPPPALRSRVLEEVAAQARSRRAGGRQEDDDDITLDPSPGAPPGPGDSDEADSPVVDLASVRERRRPRGWAAAGAVAAAVLLVLAGVTIGRLTGGDAGPSGAPTAGPSAGAMPESVSTLLAADDLEIIRGDLGADGHVTLLASRSADTAVFTMAGVPEPDPGRAYQLWLMGDHEPIPAGTMEAGEMGPSPAAMIRDISGSTQIGLTDEPAGGSPAPTGEVMLALDLD